MSAEKRTRWNSTLPAPTKPIQRKTRLARGDRPLVRGTPIKARNAKRKGHRFPKLVNEAFREYVRGLPCCVCWQPPPSHPHHVKTRGSGGGDAFNLVPLSPRCHAELHATGRKTFAAKHGVDLAAIAVQITAHFRPAPSGSPGAAP